MTSDRRVTVNVVLHPDAGARRLPESVAAVVEELGGTATPQFDGSDDPGLLPYWLATTPAEHADELAERLRAMPEVDGAYLKPGEEPA